MNNFQKIIKLASVLLLLSLFILMIMSIYYLSSKNGIESSQESTRVALFLKKIAAENFMINDNDTFWRITVNQIVRKAAHFLEYMTIGIISCTLLNIIIRKAWPSAVLSMTICTTIACIDEYRQGFIPGRTSKWFDIKVDISGLILGVLLTSVVFIITRYIQKIKLRIRELEGALK